MLRKTLLLRNVVLCELCTNMHARLCVVGVLCAKVGFLYEPNIVTIVTGGMTTTLIFMQK